MKYYKPTERLLDLGLVLQYDSQEKVIFNTRGFEREMINQERGRILQGDFDYWQTKTLETKISNALLEIKRTKWKPEKPINYAFTYNEY